MSVRAWMLGAACAWAAGGVARADCVRQGTVVRTSQLEPRLHKGEFIHVYAGRCGFRIDHGTAVMVLAETPHPQLRVARAVPGDVVTVERRGALRTVLVNGVQLVNSQGRPYRFSPLSALVLEQHLQPWGGRLPEDAFLLLGDRTDFTLRTDGLKPVLRGDILGVVMDEPPEGVSPGAPSGQ